MASAWPVWRLCRGFFAASLGSSLAAPKSRTGAIRVSSGKQDDTANDSDDPHEVLERWFNAKTITRSQRQSLRRMLASPSLGENELHAVLEAAFSRAANQLGRDAKPVLDVTHEVARVVVAAAKSRGTASGVAEAIFSPGERCRARLIELLASSTRTADVCVFTLTDNELAGALVRAHRRGVRVRVLTEDDTTAEPGSDINGLAADGLEIRRETGEGLMHHKFVVVDDRILATGSYNWTEKAARMNFDNLVVVDDTRLVRPFADQFEKMWGA